MTTPEILAVCVCATVSGAINKAAKKAEIQKESNTRTEIRMRSLLSRLAREVKVVRVSGIVSGFRGCGLRRSPGSAALRRAAFPPRNSGQWLARNFSRLTVARRRRFCTVFPARSLRPLWRSVLSSTGFSLWGFVIASIKPRRLKPAPPNPPNSAVGASVQIRKKLRNVLAAARAQIHARPPGGTQLHIQRRVKHLLQ